MQAVQELVPNTGEMSALLNALLSLKKGKPGVHVTKPPTSAEIKTAVFKAVHDTDYTAAKRTVRLRGSALAADAARGLSFAFRAPRRRALQEQRA